MISEIYIVLECTYDETGIIGVYINKEKAEQIKKMNKNFIIKTYGIDKLTDYGRLQVETYIEDLKEDVSAVEDLLKEN